MFNPMKTLKSIAVFKTQKNIREQLLKEDFFEHILSQIKVDLSSSEDDFLMNYLLKEKYGAKEEKTIKSEQEAGQETFKQNISPVDQVDISLYQISSRNIFQKRNLTACQPIKSKIKQKKVPSSIKSTIYSNCVSDDSYSHPNNHIRNGAIGQNRSRTKFHKIPFKVRRNREISSLKKDQKRSTNLNSSEGCLSKNYLLKNYNEHFIKNIFERHTFQFQQQSIMQVGDEFNDSSSFRKTDQFEEDRIRHERKFKNLTSIQFQRSPRKKLRMKINPRRF